MILKEPPPSKDVLQLMGTPGSHLARLSIIQFVGPARFPRQQMLHSAYPGTALQNLPRSI